VNDLTPDEMAALADEEANLVATAAEWHGAHPSAGRAELRRFARSCAKRPPARAIHDGRVTRRA
jgi:hypothetical protein